MLKHALFLAFSLLLISPPSVLAYGANTSDHTTITITRSLNFDAKKANISPKIVKTLIRIFSWEIDFNKDLHKGDRFIIVGKQGANPSALIYIGATKRVAVFSYIDKRGRFGYYDINGKSLYPSFLKAPLKYERISSKFQRKRFHPILKTWRPHRAVDYAAKRGTPVYAVASGVIQYRKRIGALGNAVQIKHGSNYVTVYAHLSKFARGLKPSSKVKKGQVIGYVGSTGRSTGPHLHYELRYKGIRQNPLTHPLPKQKQVAHSDFWHFKNRANTILRSL
ncbi:MAG: peptidoglycan DD-metalloendopeptidase family protein [Gammaproteobacteria bacterium]|jgi:murein DD-endopeptidase MepM/ murein hydrolase activator NlpD|nr:peptidoglycan DD-metalloendopeptidase family protein [Gammaproteobacteria bacterium]